MATSLVIDALNMAAWTRRGVDIDGVVCHSDAGSQYTAIAYTDRLAEIGAAPSIGTVGDSFDNADGGIGHRTVQDRVAPQPRRPGHQRGFMAGPG